MDYKGYACDVKLPAVTWKIIKAVLHAQHSIWQQL